MNDVAIEGRVIADRYDLAGVLGSGAETIVFRARDLLTGDEIAVKVFRASALQNPATLKAFRRDLAVLRDDTHPNVVRIFDFGETAGAFYVAMELMHGAALSRHIVMGTRWSRNEALEALEQLSNALAWLHSHGLAHGDIRTANIVRDEGVIKLMDFGPQRDSRQATRQAPVSLCPYWPPERLMGRPLTAASDLYSVAAVIYELVAGEPPNAAAGLVERATAPAPRLDAGDAPEGLARILESCLDPDPALRPASAAEIAEQCRRLRGGDATPSRIQAAGPVLADRIGAPMDVSEMSALLLATCRVLREIHEAGMAHPDLAPRNIGLSKYGPVVIEAIPAPPPNSTLMMTEPKYAAPEMLLTHTTRGGAAHTRSDIYVLGFIAYEVLAGAEAFRREVFEPGGEPESDLFWMKWHADPAKRLKPLSDVNHSVPQEFSSLIQRMIEKDATARIESLNDVESALMQLQRRLVATDDIEVMSLSGSAAGPQAERNAVERQRRAPSYMLLLIFVLACGGAVWWWSGAGRRFAPMATQPFRWIGQKAAWTRTAVHEFARRRASASSAPALASTIETATGPMVLVPAGRFMIGSSVVPNEAPAHTAYLSAFYIDKYEVSNGRYRAFTDSTGYSQPPAPSWDADYFAKSSHPVINVSWRDAQAFCIAAGKRLPTEPEWEKAARGSSPSSRFWANWTVPGLANLKREGPGAPSPVGAFPADVSPFGAYDMAGNVHEWVNDQYGLYSGNSLLLDRAGAAKVVRGGSYALAPVELSPSWRASLDPSIAPGTDSPVGFRCVADQSAADGPISRPPAQSRP